MKTWGIKCAIVFSIVALQRLVISGDPCPNKNDLAPCTCTHVEIRPSLSKETSLPTSPLPRLRRSIDTTPNENHVELHSGDRSTEERENSTFYTVVQCKVPKSRSLLEEAVTNGLHRKSVDKLIVTNVPPEREHTLIRLPKSWLKFIRVKQFEIRDSILSGDFIHYGNPFEGQEQSLISFNAINCYLYGSLTFDTAGTVNSKGLNTLPRIEVINFSRNHLIFLSNMAFRYPPTNLTTIILSYNSIQIIEGSVFTYSPKLKSIDLSHNLIENVVRSYFAAPARSLEDINLSWNNIRILPVDMFTNMPALKVVNLAHNFLYSLTGKPWASVWNQLKFIELRGNFIECSCDLLWLLNILSPSKANVSTTPAPTALPGQTVLGTCDYTEPQMYARTYHLVKLTRNHLNCNA